MGSRPNRLGIRGLDQLDDAGDGGLRILDLHEVEVALSFGRIEIGNRALVDAMSAGDDATLRGLPEHFGEAHHRHGAGRDDVGQHLAGPDRGKLVDVADDQESGPVRHCLHERLHQHDVDHLFVLRVARAGNAFGFEITDRAGERREAGQMGSIGAGAGDEIRTAIEQERGVLALHGRCQASAQSINVRSLVSARRSSTAATSPASRATVNWRTYRMGPEVAA